MVKYVSFSELASRKTTVALYRNSSEAMDITQKSGKYWDYFPFWTYYLLRKVVYSDSSHRVYCWYVFANNQLLLIISRQDLSLIDRLKVALHIVVNKLSYPFIEKLITTVEVSSKYSHTPNVQMMLL